MSTNNHQRRRRSAIALIAVFLLTLVAVPSVAADSTAQTLPFSPGLARHEPDHCHRRLVRRARHRRLPGTGHHDDDRRRPADVADRLDGRERRRRHRQHPARRSTSRTAASANSSSDDPVVALQDPTAPPTRRTSSSTSRRPASGTSRSLRPARHRRHDRQRRAARRPPVPGRIDRHVDERSGRVRRRRNDGPESGRRWSRPVERHAPLRRERPGRWSRSGSSRPMPSRATSGSASTTSQVTATALDKRAGRRCRRRRAVAPLTSPATRTSR